MFRFIKQVVFHSLILMTLLVHVHNTYAQRPPTGGAAPLNEEEDSSINPLVFVIGGAVLVGAATVLIVKSKAPKIPVAQQLPSYLLAHNILPNEDALDLMYQINPSLMNMPEISPKKKLILPDFPELNQSLASNLTGSIRVTASQSLLEQVNRFQYGTKDFNNLNIENASSEMQDRYQKVNTITMQVERSLITSGYGKGQNATASNELVIDLLEVFNQTLVQINETKTITQEQVGLLQSIADNLGDLVTDLEEFSRLQEELRKLGSLELTEQYKLFASLNRNREEYRKMRAEDEIPTNQSFNVAAGNTMNFALAVYKYSEQGELITEGPEVEGKYTIRYVLPALKDYENAYHTIRNPATYAIGAFPPAKIYMVVEDEEGNRMDITHPVVDFKLAFDSRQLVNENKMIVVPLKINP